MGDSSKFSIDDFLKDYEEEKKAAGKAGPMSKPMKDSVTKSRGGNRKRKAAPSDVRSDDVSVPVCVHLPRKLFSRLKAQSHLEGRTASSLVADSLDRHLMTVDQIIDGYKKILDEGS